MKYRIYEEYIIYIYYYNIAYIVYICTMYDDT